MLTIHRSERADALVDALAELLAVAPADPFTPEVVAVPSRGVERWISQRLSTTLGAGPRGGDGVCAHVRFPSPSRLVADAVSCGVGLLPEDDPWAATRLQWSLLEVVDQCATEHWCRTLGTHIGAVGSGDLEHRRGRRVAVASKVAALFTRYSQERPDLVRAWVAGDDGDIAADLRWQPELFRRLRKHLGTSSPAERLDEACASLRAQPDLVDLPERIALFGPTRLSTVQLLVLDALADGRDVHLMLPHPSRGLWERIASASQAVVARREDATADLVRHPLLAALGRDTRELQIMIGAHATSPVTRHHDAPEAPSTLLGRLQRDLRGDRAPGGDHELTAGDRSVQVHSCHGRLRQVEVMREVLLGLLQDDPTLELRDVVVMCPDIEAFAPLLSATFGLGDDQTDDQTGEAHPGHQLRVRLADRSLRETNPVLTVVTRLLDFADARLTASQVLDFASLEPVRRRFGLDDAALERVDDWVRRAGVRWGLDAAARTPYHLEGVPQGTWRAGLDRVLLGVAMDEDGLRTFGEVLPLDDVDSSEIDLAGRLAELVDRLAAAVDSLSGATGLLGWVHVIEQALDSLTSVAFRDGWQLTQARQQLADAVSAAGERAETVSLSLADVRSLLAVQLRGRPTRANFRTGHLTMCSMVPMRSVPHRVVILLGLDDQAFPRHVQADGDDLLAREPRIGERDARAEDRQLLLDAVMSAEEHLVLLYSGHDERTGAGRPPAVPLGELLDVLERTANAAVDELRGHVLTEHPLQPFDPRCFRAEAPASFDKAALAGARSSLAPRVGRQAFLEAALPAPSADVVELADLTAFFEHPVKAFLRQRLGLALVSDDADPSDALSVELRGLEQWQVGNRLLRAGLSGQEFGAAAVAELARGELPPGPLGHAVLQELRETVVPLVDGSAGIRSKAPDSADVDVELPSGTRLLGTVTGLHGDCLLRVEFSRLKPKHRLVAWLRLLVLSAHDPSRPWSSMVAARDDRRGIARAWIPGVDAGEALAQLELLVELYLSGLRQPLPIAELTSWTYAERRIKGASPDAAVEAARAVWRKLGRQGPYGEFSDEAHLCVWPDGELDALLAEPATTGAEPTRFGELAVRLWEPLLRVEERRAE